MNKKVYVVSKTERVTNQHDELETTVFKVYRSEKKAKSVAKERTEKEGSVGMDRWDWDVWYSVDEAELVEEE